jgi:phosphoserine phosphatase
MTSLTRIVLVRHGDVPGIAPPAFRGRTDLKLTARGIRQAEASRDRLASSFQFDSVYTSPLSRCVRLVTLSPSHTGRRRRLWRG